VRLQEAISTLRQGIDTILNCDVPYEQMDAALKLVEEKFTSTNKQSTPCMYCETVGAANCPHHGSDSRFPK